MRLIRVRPISQKPPVVSRGLFVSCYIDDAGTARNYIPDFWLPEEGVFEEVNGYFRDKAKRKMNLALDANPQATVRVIETTQEWCRIERGEKPDVSRMKLVEGWRKQK